jgi:hypothetical protein
MLASSLTPSLPSPMQSIPFLQADNNILQCALLISLTPAKYMSPRLRMFTSKIMYGVMKWGLENN